MPLITLVLAAALQATPQDRYTVAGDLQAMYDELTQTTLSALTPEEVDDYHSVFFTPDWTFTDRAGVHHTWPEMRDQAIRTAAAQPFENARDVIRKMFVKGDRDVAEVTSITVRNITDSEGKYGSRGATHTIAEATPMRDSWVRTPTGWKLQSREQVGEPKVFVDKLPPEMDNPRAPVVKTS
jgi:hypothetical protein